MTRSKNGSLLMGLGTGVVFIGGVMVAGYFVQVQDAVANTPETVTEAPPVSSPELKHIQGAVDAFVAGDVELTIGDRSVTMSYADLGLALDPDSASRAQLTDGNLDGFVPVAINHEVATKALLQLKQSYDHPPRNAYLDLERRKVNEAVDGWGLDVHGSISAIEAGAREGAKKIALVGAVIPAPVTTKELGIDDISVVISTFTTRFAVGEKARNANLKLLATHLDGFVMKPGDVLEFNKVTGDRTEKEGYKMAHVIEAGEMVDGMAGGSCQISTTLHGAAFFAGLEIVDSTPHSRPSTYVTMGLDATVVYPTTDLKLRNPFDFPVVIHYKVARGEATVEILGKEKPYDEIAFERNVHKQIPFETITREDESIPVGHMVIDQAGFYGYRITRRRVYYKGGKEVKQDSWSIGYSPVVEYVRMGVNPDPNLPPPKGKKPHGPKPQGSTRVVQ